MTTLRSPVVAALANAAALFSAPPLAAAPEPVQGAALVFLGAAELPAGLAIDGVPLGGLSALAWDPERQVYYALSDDPGWRGPVRFYTLAIDLAGGRLAEDGVRVQGVTTLTDPDGRPFEDKVIDGEGLAMTPDGTLLLASEGNVEEGIGPSLWELGLDGRARRRLAVPRDLRPDGAGRRGVRHNQAFEALTVTTDGREFLLGTESSVVQDGPVADLEQGSWSRITRFDRATGRARASYLYLTEPVAEAPRPADGLAINGLVELVALGDHRLLALERSYSVGGGNTVRLFGVALPPPPAGRRGRWFRRAPGKAAKELWLDLGELGLELDNLEGMVLGPTLADGSRALLLVSDDNFNTGRQRTQILAFALRTAAPRIPEIQGAGHRSPWDSGWVRGVGGVVTAIDGGDSGAGFWLQDERGDRDPATSDALFVATAGAPPVESGDRVRVDGRVAERARGNGLSVTRLEAARVEVIASGGPLPEPARIGPSHRAAPSRVIDDDGLESYQPESDGIDFYESLEGMRVEVRDALVVGPTNRYGVMAIVPDGGREAGPWTPRGGLLLRPDDANPERLEISSRLVAPPPAVNVGDRLPGAIQGVLDYEFGTFRLLSTAPLPAARAAEGGPAPAPFPKADEALVIATYNVLNLDPGDGDEKYRRLAESMVAGLGAPDILALQEIQDDSGPDDDGTVTAIENLTQLVAAIETAGGPAYTFASIDPVDGANGGQPGGNIRNAYLYREDRVRLLDLAVIEDQAFRADPETGYAPSRFPLVGVFDFGGRRFVLANVHLKSKGGDDPLFGARQPPIRRTEHQRLHQARAVGEQIAAQARQDPCTAVVLLGDLNEFDFRPPVEALADYGLVNLTTRVPVEDRYSFNFQGNSQLLDHILVTPELAAPGVARIFILHGNADFADGHRASDHDPVVAQFTRPACRSDG